MSFNRKTTVWLKPSVAEVLRWAKTEREVDDWLVEARLTFRDAAASTKRRWEKVAQKVKERIRIDALQVGSRLVGLDGKPL